MLPTPAAISRVQMPSCRRHRIFGYRAWPAASLHDLLWLALRRVAFWSAFEHVHVAFASSASDRSFRLSASMPTQARSVAAHLVLAAVVGVAATSAAPIITTSETSLSQYGQVRVLAPS